MPTSQDRTGDPQTPEPRSARAFDESLPFSAEQFVPRLSISEKASMWLPGLRCHTLINHRDTSSAAPLHNWNSCNICEPENRARGRGLRFESGKTATLRKVLENAQPGFLVFPEEILKPKSLAPLRPAASPSRRTGRSLPLQLFLI